MADNTERIQTLAAQILGGDSKASRKKVQRALLTAQTLVHEGEGLEDPREIATLKRKVSKLGDSLAQAHGDLESHKERNSQLEGVQSKHRQHLKAAEKKASDNETAAGEAESLKEEVKQLHADLKAETARANKAEKAAPKGNKKK